MSGRPWLRLVVPLALLALWEGVTRAGWIDSLFLPRASDVARALWAGLARGPLLADAGVTLARAAGGFALSLLVGVPLGFVVGHVRAVATLLEPTVDFLRSIPPTALLPLFQLAFAVGDASKLAVVTFGCSLVVLVHVAAGARQARVERQRAARVLGLGTWQRLWWIVVPETAPQLLAGARVAASLALMLMVVSEMFVGTTRGLGFAIASAGNRFAMPECYAAIVLTGAMGWAAGKGLARLERRLVHWSGR